MEARWELPATLGAVAGLTLTADGRLLASDKESGNVSEIDSRTGRVVKTFRLGRQTVHADFVGLTTTADGGVFQLDRSGTIVDPFGHMWSVATHIEDVSPEEMKKRMAKASGQSAAG